MINFSRSLKLSIFLLFCFKNSINCFSQKIHLVDPFSGEYAVVHFNYQNGKSKAGLIDKNEKILIPAMYDDLIILKGGNILAVYNDKIGIVDAQNKILVPFEYENINNSDFDQMELIALQKNGKNDVFNKFGKKINIYPLADATNSLNTNTLIQDNKGNFAKLSIDGTITKIIESSKVKYCELNDSGTLLRLINYKNECSLINISNQIIIPSGMYDDIEFIDDHSFVRVSKSNKWGVLDIINNSITVPLIYDYLGIFHKNMLVCKSNKLEGIINVFNKVITPSIYQEIYKVRDNIARIKINGLYGFIDTQGMAIIQPIYEGAYDFSEGLTIVENKYRRAIIDKNGNNVTQFVFRYITGFKNGYAVASYNNEEFFLVDAYGNCKYNCE